MEHSDEIWYFLDMIKRTISRLPNIDAGPAGRVSVAGTIKDKSTITTRTTKSFPSFALVMVHAGRGTFRSGPAVRPGPAGRAGSGDHEGANVSNSSDHGPGNGHAGEEPVQVGRGDLLLLFPGVPHSYGPLPGERWDESYLVFTGELFDALRNGDVISSASPVIYHLDDHWQERFLGLVQLAGAGTDGNAAPSGRVETPAPVYLCMLASFIAEAATAHPVHHVNAADSAWLDEAWEALDAERPMSQSLADVAERLGTSYGSFVKR